MWIQMMVPVVCEMRSLKANDMQSLRDIKFIQGLRVQLIGGACVPYMQGYRCCAKNKKKPKAVIRMARKMA